MKTKTSILFLIITTFLTVPFTALTMERNNQVITRVANGHAFTAWDNQGRIFASHFDPNTQTWEDPIQISIEGTNSHPQITTDNNNNIIVIWRNADDGRSYSARYDLNTATWGEPEMMPGPQRREAA